MSYDLIKVKDDCQCFFKPFLIHFYNNSQNANLSLYNGGLLGLGVEELLWDVNIGAPRQYLHPI
jgi:hypothetical protein